jgi:hypothetical protein
MRIRPTSLIACSLALVTVRSAVDHSLQCEVTPLQHLHDLKISEHHVMAETMRDANERTKSRLAKCQAQKEGVRDRQQACCESVQWVVQQGPDLLGKYEEAYTKLGGILDSHRERCKICGTNKNTKVRKTEPREFMERAERQLEIAHSAYAEWMKLFDDMKEHCRKSVDENVSAREKEASVRDEL